MEKNTALKYVKQILLALLLLGAVVFLNLTVQEKTANKNNRTTTSKLSIAVVNEDTPVTDERGQEYNLGASYIKKLEKDDANFWTVTSRGSAETGLKNNRYQLMIVIPSNFSAKVLDVNSLTTDKALVTYTVSSNGNDRIESEANKVGAQIVSDLNGQLVNIYMASILENLYVAQQNAMTLSDIHSTNIETYTTSVYGTALSFKDDFSPLLSSAESSFSANDGLLNMLNSSLDDGSNLAGSQIGTSGAGASTGNGNVANRVVAMTDEEVKVALNRLLESVQNNQSLLEAKEESPVSQPSSPAPQPPATSPSDQSPAPPDSVPAAEPRKNTGSDKGENETNAPSTPAPAVATGPTYSQLLETLQKEIDAIDAELKTIESANKEEAKVVAARISAKLRDYYGKEADGKLTVKDFLLKSTSEEYVAGLESQQVAIQAVINQLPSLDPSALAGQTNGLGGQGINFKYAGFASAYYGKGYQASDLANQLAAAKEKLNQTTSQSVSGKTGQATYVYHYNATQTPPPATPSKDDAKAPSGGASVPADQANPPASTPPSTPAPSAPPASSTPPSSAPSTPSSSTPASTPSSTTPSTTQMTYKKKSYQVVTLNNNGQTTGTATILVSAPDLISVTGLTANGQAISSGVGINLVDGNNSIVVNYTYKERATNLDQAPAITISVTSNKGTASQTIPVDLSPYLNNTEYVKAVENYSRLLQKTEDVYATADAVLEASSLVDGTGQRTPIASLLNQDITDYLEGIVMANLTVAYGGSDNKTIAQLRETKANLEKNLEALKVSDQDILAQISTILEGIDGQLTNPNGGAQPADGPATGNGTAGIDPALANKLVNLHANTANLRTASATRLSNTEGVVNSFQIFKNQVATAQANSDNLSKSAEALMTEFNEELAHNGDFVDAFSKVFNNAYNNGVANEVLLDFLSNPVGHTSTSIQAATNVYRPFTWILLIEIVTLFIAYIFGTQDVTEKVKNKYQLDKLPQTEVTSVSIMTGLGLFSGLLLGIISAQQLLVARSAVLPWILLNILFSLILIFGQYFLIRNFRVLGMGAALFMLISYIYLTGAIGTAVTLDGGAMQWIKGMNFLSLFEGSLTSFAMNQIISIGLVFLLIVSAIGLGVLNIFAQPLLEKIKINRGKVNA